MANEKRLIDANALMEKIQFRLPITNDVNRIINKCVLITRKAIVEAPTVDAVEVVRCKDCHWWRLVNKRNGCGICQHEVFSVDDCTIDPVTEPTDFCSYGERREGE